MVGEGCLVSNPVMLYIALQGIIYLNLFRNECDKAKSLLCIRVKGLNTRGKENGKWKISRF